MDDRCVAAPYRPAQPPSVAAPVGTPFDPSVREADDVARELGVDPAVGLSDAEAARRLAADGPNELRSRPPVPLWRKILDQFRDPLVALLLVAVGISVAVWWVEGAEGVPVDAVVIAAIIVLNAVLGLVQESKAANAVAALRSMTEATSTVLRDGRRVTVRSAELVRGDVLVLAEGDAVGADARLLSATALRVQESSLTGESEAVLKDAAVLPARAPLGDRFDMVYKGTAVAQGVGRAVVVAAGMDTQMGAIAQLLDATEEEVTPLQREISHVSKVLGLTVIGIAVVVMVLAAVVNGVRTAADLVTVLLLGVSLAVAAVPEGLPAILSVVLAVGVQAMARRNAVVKKLHSAETLGSASVIASDKTGTLTKNEMTIQRVVTASGEVTLTGVGYRPDGEARTGADDGGAGQPVTDERLVREVAMVLGGGSLANDAQLVEHHGEWAVQGDPTEAAFLVAAHKLTGTVDRVAGFERRGEVPFTSERKMMSALVDPPGDGAWALVTKGAPDVLLTRCSDVQVGDETVPLDDERRAAALDAVERLSRQAYRTLGVAYRRVAEGLGSEGLEEHESDLVYLGTVGIIDPPRPEVTAAVAEAHRAGIRVIMITGDHPITATRIATDLGIVEPGARAVTGVDLDGLDAAGLRETTRTVSVYARVAPQNKLQIVDALQADGHVVAMTGDGVNDAPALKTADIGVAMGITGTEVTKESAKMILGDDNFATIVAAVRQGRIIFDNIKKFLRYLLSSNMGEVCTVLFGVVLAGVVGLDGAAGGEAVVVPLLATQILWINLVTDSGPALAMGVDPETDDVMARPPRGTNERIIDARMWTGVLSIGFVMGVATLLTIDIFLPGGLVEGNDSLTVARTAGFTTLVLAQLFNVLNSRSETTSAFHRMFVNRWLWGAIGLGVVLQVAVVQVPFLQVAFGTAGLDLAHWGVAVAMASSVLWFDEIRKLVWRARRAGVPA
ncbi:calcium-translocating P-type ATPase/potassium/sodium efflux P-type ATPase,TIGR01523 [Promicromonospora sp. AC04]|uniref:cation-translocating P-type ATPase n=1 Tax=Promicromonospora sp. AC04 TaxID=2135723 RepID=UPI000D35F04A|nr:calcium-translocating P-type ATPase/potassium/sodium efflux P-type ATPase,TIGR01523 [Promicromonospora sp. AC04]